MRGVSKETKRSRKAAARTCVALLTLSLALSACSEPPSVQTPIRPVKAAVVPPADTQRVLTYSGVLVPRIESTLGFRVPGKIVERFVNAGDQIKAGDAIARLDEKDLKLAENSARTNATAAKTRLDVAKDALKRANYLLPNGFIAQSAVDQRQLETDSAQSAYNAAVDQLNQSINATSYGLLAAEKDGIVTSVKAEPGQVVSIGQAVITLAHAEDIEVLVAVPEQEIARFHPGDVAAIALWARSETGSSGRIREIAGTADPASRTYPVRVTINNKMADMRLGMTTSVGFSVAEQPAVMVPLSALTKDGERTIVYIASRDTETVMRREVEAEGITGDSVRIKSGLAPGEILVTGGVQFLHDGMKVRLPRDVLPAVAASTQR